MNTNNIFWQSFGFENGGQLYNTNTNTDVFWTRQPSTGIIVRGSSRLTNPSFLSEVRDVQYTSTNTNTMDQSLSDWGIRDMKWGETPCPTPLFIGPRYTWGPINGSKKSCLMRKIYLVRKSYFQRKSYRVR